MRTNRRVPILALSVLMFVMSFGGAPTLWSIGVSGLSLTLATPARADCLIGGLERKDIADGDCLEAQRTGCVRSKLSDVQYRNCLAAVSDARSKEKACVIAGQVRYDLNAADCEEGKRTGCVRRLLSDSQYSACLKAQAPKDTCVVAGQQRPDLQGLDCDEAKATGCVRRLLTPTQYQACLNAQPLPKNR